MTAGFAPYPITFIIKKSSKGTPFNQLICIAQAFYVAHRAIFHIRRIFRYLRSKLFHLS